MYDTLDRIAEGPAQGLEVRPGLRRILLVGFPYAVFYSLDVGTIVVLAVAHQSRRPGYWRGRAR